MFGSLARILPLQLKSDRVGLWTIPPCDRTQPRSIGRGPVTVRILLPVHFPASALYLPAGAFVAGAESLGDTGDDFSPNCPYRRWERMTPTYPRRMICVQSMRF